MPIKQSRLSVTHYQLPKVLSEELRKFDWRYQLSDFTTIELKKELARLSREQLIEWLEWNDPNGIYSDSASDIEGMKHLSKSQAENLVFSQLSLVEE